jgi:hypothetical protein
MLYKAAPDTVLALLLSVSPHRRRRYGWSQKETQMLNTSKCVVAAVLLTFTFGSYRSSIRASAQPQAKPPKVARSSMGRFASRVRAALKNRAGALSASNLQQRGGCFNEPDCETETMPELPARTQSETSIAVDTTGQHIVVGFNDFRGLTKNPASLSGFMYSDDGGETFVDGEQLPSPGDQALGGTRLPQIAGDPDVKYVGGCTFIYSSIIIKQFSATQVVTTLGVHRSTDCGHTWTGPFEVVPATNPNGRVDVNGGPVDDADKEFMDVDPDTGRVIVSWSNFTPTSVEISTAYSDNLTTIDSPTWSTRQIVANSDADGQASIPRFAARGSANAYIAWQRFFDDGTDQIGFSRSTNNGTTWSAPVEIAPQPFFTLDHILGNDRVNSSPSLAVDHSRRLSRGNLYVVYATNDLHDGADIAFQRSTDEGLTFSTPILLNSRPGNDRSQWFPWVTVDSTTGRIHVFYYDQGIPSSGDLTQVSHTFSDDEGITWQQPLPLTDRPFHAGWGNDTSEPNLGDYNQGVAQGGNLVLAYAAATRPPDGFADGQPTSTSLTVPDVVIDRVHIGDRRSRAATVDLGVVKFVESGGDGFIDPGDTVRLTIPIRNYVTNPLNAQRVRDVESTLTTDTPGVTVLRGESTYRNLSPGITRPNRQDFVLRIDPMFAPGTPIELALEIRSSGNGTTRLLHTLTTGTPLPTLLLSENFDAAAPGVLPSGWTAAHGAGVNIVPWITSNTFCGATSNAAFHQNAADGPQPNAPLNSRWERLFSPVFFVPGDSDYVTIDMNVCYDSEDDPAFNVLAYDGFFLRILDLTTGRLQRSVLVEAFEDEFTTDGFFHYPKHLPRSGDPSYFSDMSVWAGDSRGFKHVHLKLPGMAGSTAQLRFEFTQDGFATCAFVRPGHSCGVAIDDIVVQSVRSVAP